MNKAQQKFLQRFLTYLTVEKSSSLLTVNNYERDINSFSEFLVTRFGESFQWKQVGALDILITSLLRKFIFKYVKLLATM